jgi:hypothetical protein
MAAGVCALMVLAVAVVAEEGDGAGSRAAGGGKPAAEAKDGAEKAAGREKAGDREREGGVFARADANNDGKIDKDELAAIEKKSPRVAAVLQKADTNKDGVIDEKEIAAAAEQSKTRRDRKEKDGGKEKDK